MATDRDKTTKDHAGKGTRDEAAIHKRREAVNEEEARTPVRGEPLAESDRTGRKNAPTPASEPTRE